MSRWYSQLVGQEGHYYHQKIIIPSLLQLLKAHESQWTTMNVLDLGCGSGILGRHLPAKYHYTGIDISSSLIREAKQLDKNVTHTYLCNDVTVPLSWEQKFSHVAIVLALQNFENGIGALQNAASALLPKGQLILVLNHPCFRIPRQSSWGIDEGKKLQYRRLDRYSSPMQIPIEMHPGRKENSPQTWSYHHPLSTYCQWLRETGFMIENMEEWYSDKISVGKTSKMENRSRDEFPLFLTISARFTLGGSV